MPRTIAQRALRKWSAAIVDAVSRGETFVVTRNGIPVAELRPITGGHGRFISRADVIAVAQQGPHIDGKAFREDLDQLADQRLT